MFDGVGSPLTQTFGLGMFEPVTNKALDEIEKFFNDRGADTFHEVSPLADGSALELLNARGYQPIEFTSVMFRPIQPATTFAIERNKEISVRRITEGENGLWVKTAQAGWGETPGLSEFFADLAKVNEHNASSISFIAELSGEPIATGALNINNSIALLAGASTIPTARKQGAQLALLNRRLVFAVEQGCDISMMCAAPGSASQRNAERQGFRIAYTRIKWQLRQS